MDRIFVSISCYKDKDLANTIRSAYEKANNPDLLNFGIYFQGTSEDLNYFFENLPPGKHTIKYIPAEETKGTGWVRNILTRDMFSEEDYWLQIDSHMRFDYGWDSKLIDLYKKQNKDFLMTGFPPHFGMKENYEEYSKRAKNNKSIVCEFTEMYSFKETKGIIPKEELEDSITASGAFQFASKKVAKSMTFDEYFNPWMDQEISSCLAFMNGYDLMCPRDSVLWHCYENNHIGSDEKWRPLVADEQNVNGFNRFPFEVIKNLKTKRTWQEWHDRVLQDINLDKNW